VSSANILHPLHPLPTASANTCHICFQVSSNPTTTPPRRNGVIAVPVPGPFRSLAARYYGTPFQADEERSGAYEGGEEEGCAIASGEQAGSWRRRHRDVLDVLCSVELGLSSAVEL